MATSDEHHHKVETATDSGLEEPSVEKAEALHCETINVPGATPEEVVYTEEEANAIRRKLDFWIMPVLMISYGLQ